MSAARTLDYALPPDFAPVALGTLASRWAREDPQRPAVTCGGMSTCWQELDARANRRARALAALGVGPDDLVTILLPNSLAFYETSIALWKLGATPNPVSPRLPDLELREIVALAQPKLIIGVDAARLSGYATLPAQFEPDPALSSEPLPERLARYWRACTTGGSTGRPKLIVEHMAARWDPRVGGGGVIPGDVMLNPAPLSHTAPFRLMHRNLFTGSHVIEMGRFDAEKWLRLVERHRVTWAYLVPTMMHRIRRLPDTVRLRYDLSSLEMMVHMGAPCPVWLKESWIEWLGPQRVWEVYGGSENIGGVTIGGSEWLTHRGSVGRPPPDPQFEIRRPDGTTAAVGEVGEIWMRPRAGPHASYHYIGAQARTDGEWQSYGDLGRLDEDGYLYIEDRRMDMIVTGGINVYPAEVEAALEAHPAVQSSAVIGLPDEDLGARVHAIVEIHAAHAPPTVEELRAHVASRLVGYKVPRTFELTDQPLRDDAGKVRRGGLREARLGPSDASLAGTGRQPRPHPDRPVEPGAPARGRRSR